MKKRITSYIDQLKFDPALLKIPVASYLTNIRLVALFIIGIIIFGVFSFFTLPRRLNPEIKIPIVSVITTYPGAGPTEVEELITIPLENKLLNAKDVIIVSSSSNENVSIITTEFSSNTSVDDARSEVQKLVSEVTDLPSDSLDPQIKELDFEDVPVWQFVITTNRSRATLEQVANLLETELESQNLIDRLTISGIEEKEIQVVISQEKILDYGITPMQLMNSISANSGSLPAGKVNTATNNYSFSLGSGLESIDSVRNLPITVNNSKVKLGDISDISYKSAVNQKRSYISNKSFENQEAVTISVYKNKSADITKAQQQAEEVANQVISNFDDSIQIITLENVANDITEQFSELYTNFASTIFLVFATLFIFLGLRQATIASFSIPLTFLISFGVMSATGQTLNFLTLFSLLLALGLLVDDAIVIISAATSYYKIGRFNPKEVGLLVWRDFLVPIWTTTITTVWAFVPLLLSSGLIGEFIKPIPIVVSTTLLASTTVAVLITLPLMMVLLNLKLAKRVIVLFKIIVGIIGSVVLFNLTNGQPLAILIYLGVLVLVGMLLRWRKLFVKQVQSKKIEKSIGKVRSIANSGLINIEPFTIRYKALISKILASKKLKKQVILSVAIISIFSYALLPLGFVKNEFFPKTDSELIFITLELPTGSTIKQTEIKSLEIAKQLNTIPEVALTNIQVGQSNRNSNGGNSAGDNLAAISLKLLPESDREIGSEDLAEFVRTEVKKYKIDASVFTESGGPPAGSDVTVKIIGEELSQLQTIADKIENNLDAIPGTKNINRSVKQGNSKIVFNPDLTKLAQYNLTSQDLGLWMRTAVSGFELYEADFDELSDKTKIKMYLSENTLSPEEISQISILTKEGSVPLTELGTLTLEPSPSVINREDGNRTITVTADLAAGFNASEINTQVLAYADSLKLPRGYSFATGGANEENQKSVQSILQAMVLSLILILATMVIQLGSFRQAVIVILVIPLAISGVFLLFALTGTPLSFPALIGVLALFGIVVNNSIMVVDKINQNLKIGMNQKDAISDGAASRVEPIFFSSLTTIIGLIPISLSDPVWQGLGGAIIAGLLFSGSIMLLVIPVTYDYFYPEG